jgi:hypothetical protein
MMQAEAGKMQMEHQFELEREAVIGQREAAQADKQVLADVVKQAVQTAMQSQQPGAKAPAKAAATAS